MNALINQLSLEKSNAQNRNITLLFDFKNKIYLKILTLKKILLIIFNIAFFTNAYSQNTFNDYAQFYPIGDDPNVRYMTSYTKQEKILFEFNPTVRYSIYNNFMKGLMQEYKHTQAWYASFRPQIRVYDENSYPIKTPSYKFFLGTQHLYRLPNYKISENQEQFIGFSVESGHYSNGQSGSAFSNDFADGSKGSDSIYGLINTSTKLSEILNRNTGNFSTNLTEININFRRYSIDEKNEPKKMHSFNIGYVRYHNKFLGLGNFGGYTDEDIRIYGINRYLFGYEHLRVFKNGNGARISFKENIEIIAGVKYHINPFRSESIFTYYPFIKIIKNKIRPKAIGFFVSYIYGHDNYNYRFVDSGSQFTIGISWNQFPPFPFKTTPTSQ